MLTVSYCAEAIGAVKAAKKAGIPVSFELIWIDSKPYCMRLFGSIHGLLGLVRSQFYLVASK